MLIEPFFVKDNLYDFTFNTHFSYLMTKDNLIIVDIEVHPLIRRTASLKVTRECILLSQVLNVVSIGKSVHGRRNKLPIGR